MFKRVSVLTPAVLAVMAVLWSCSDTPSSVKEKSPDPPPARSMEVDLSAFEEPAGNSATTQAADNFKQAVLRASVIKGILGLNLVVPKTLLEAAARAEARLNEEQTWEWKYAKSVDTRRYEVRLVARREGSNNIHWSFYVTNTKLGLDDQLFFSGTSNAEGSRGTWTYFSLAGESSGKKKSQMTWKVNGKNDIALRLEVTSDRHNNQGDYIDYAYKGGVKTVVYHDASENVTTEIHFNAETNAGYLVSPGYRNGEKACWNEHFQDLSCPTS